MTSPRFQPLGPWLALVLCMAAAPARATSGDCARVPDGSPCRTDCRIDGVCLGGLCLGGLAAPDGSACATGLICTTNDACREGLCRPGAPVKCAAGPCGAADCVEGLGCAPVVPCDMPGPPDLANRDLVSLPDFVAVPDGFRAALDLARADGADGPPPDGAVAIDGLVPAPDGGAVDTADMAATPDDLAPTDGDATGDLAIDVPDGDLPDDDPPDLVGQEGGSAAFDADLPDDGGAPDGPPIHVHGSGCALSGRGSPAGMMLLLFFVAVGARLRHRASRRRAHG